MKRILICPLDWGLGHATRSVPVIRELLRQGADVVMASSGPAGVLLRKEFPSLTYAELPGYNPTYPAGGSMMIELLSQLAKFHRVVLEEHKAVSILVRDHRIDAVISDNRYGCYSEQVKSIFVTHQIQVLLPGVARMLAPVVNAYCQRYIRRYDEVWVPDQLGSGLTTPFIPDTMQAVKFVGWLSRFQGPQRVDKKYDVAVVVSGPEPQRSLLVAKAREQLKKLAGKSMLVTGEPDLDVRTTDGPIEIFSHLTTAGMEAALNSADIVIARSGYSTIMDLIVLQKKAIFVPTPQQPEQQFLGGRLMDLGIALCVDQDELALEQQIDRALDFNGLSALRVEKGVLEKEIKSLLI